MVELSKLRTDPEAQVSGIWSTYYVGENGEADLRVLIASTDSVEYTRARSKKILDLQRKTLGGTISDEAFEEVTLDLYSEYIVRDWEGVEINGEAIPCTPDKVREILADGAYRHFYDYITLRANDVARFREGNLQALEGNSETASGGN